MPQCPQDIPIIVFRFEGKNNKSKELRVRKQKVLDALKWLTGNNENGEPNNILYNDVVIDYDRLDQLPSDDYLGLPLNVDFDSNDADDDLSDDEEENEKKPS